MVNCDNLKFNSRYEESFYEIIARSFLSFFGKSLFLKINDMKNSNISFLANDSKLSCYLEKKKEKLLSCFCHLRCNNKKGFFKLLSKVCIKF